MTDSDRKLLRERAEKDAESRKTHSSKDHDEADVRALLHELEVHQIELEMQNAELRSARDEGETLGKKYSDLYDFAPGGYFTLEPDATIRLVNLRGSTLVGIDRSHLTGTSFAMLLDPADRRAFHLFLDRIFESGDGLEMDARLISNLTGERRVSIHARRSPAGEECLAAVSDITARTKPLGNQPRLVWPSRRQELRLRAFSKRIIEVQEEERKRISRDLHDIIAQTLVAINVDLAALEREADGSPAGLLGKIAHTRRMIEQSVETVHRFSRELRPAMLDELGLIPALEVFLNSFMAATGIRTGLDAFAGIEEFSGEIRTALYRIAQEALSNVAAHSGASEVRVSVIQEKQGISMTIADNGRGFDAAADPPSRRNKRLGLMGMKERAEMVGGTFSIQSMPGGSTTVRILIPSAKPETLDRS